MTLFLECTKLSPGFPAVGYKNLFGILKLRDVKCAGPFCLQFYLRQHGPAHYDLK